jgi:hypothetical protein
MDEIRALEVSERLKQLADEDGETTEEMVAKLVLNEDRLRHIVKLPFLPEKRVRCYNANCTEGERRLDALEMVDV